MEYRLDTFNEDQEQELQNLFKSLDDIQIFVETTNVLTAEEYDQLTNFKWESYEEELNMKENI
jgi:hypothetical protein